jgi:hypothetical protein
MPILAGFVVALALLGTLVFVVGVDAVLAALATADRGAVIAAFAVASLWMGAWSYSLHLVLGTLGIPTSAPRSFLLYANTLFTSDLLHGLKTVASGHRMTALATQGISVPTRTQREPAAYRRNSRFLPRYRAVTRSRRSHRNPCHRCVTNRPYPSPPLVCWGPASHRFRRKLTYVGPR